MSALFSETFPAAHFTLVDVASAMLDRARERFASNSASSAAGDSRPAGSTRDITSEAASGRFDFLTLDYARHPLPGGPYDIIISGLSIHHVSDVAKRTLFRRIGQALAPGGAFVNADQVLSTTPALQAQSLALWRRQGAHHRRHSRAACRSRRPYARRPARYARSPASLAPFRRLPARRRLVPQRYVYRLRGLQAYLRGTRVMTPASTDPSRRFAPPYVAGIDGGTEALKVGIFDLAGHLVASASVNYPTRFPQSGWAEQDPTDWWQALGEASQRCFASANIDPKDVVAISADGTTCTLLPLDADDRPLRAAFLWMDVRAAQQAQRITDSGHPALKYSPSGVSAEWMPPKALWLKEHQPDVYRQTHSFIEYTDWLALSLTGRRTLNLCTATQRWFYDRPNGGWPAGVFEAIGLEDIHAKLPADVLPMGAHLGEVTTEAAAHTGFAAGTPVFAGGCDAAAGTLALNVVQPGQLALVTGSSNVLMGFTDLPLHVRGLMGSFPDAVIPNLELIEAGQVSTGSVIAWFRREFAADLMRDHPNDSGAIYRILDAEAAQIPPGSGGVVVLKTFQGNRSPYADALARGAIWGLSLASTRAHIYRALLEGITYGTAHILDVLATHGYRPTGLTAAGGATRHRLFLQLYADVTGIPVRTTETTEASLLGSAIATATGAGRYPRLATASAGMVRTAETYDPDPPAHERYKFWVDKYARTYQQLKPLMHESALPSA